MLKLYYDEAIPLDHHFCADDFLLIRFKASQLTPEFIRDADILVVRSVTRVHRGLLQYNRRLRVIASATSGTDHIDQDYLDDCGIKLIYAPGANAESVANYVLTALLLCYADRLDAVTPQQLTLAIIGLGCIGQKVYRCAELMGFNLVVHDPFQASRHPMANPQKIRFVDMDQALHADVISLHVPLTYAEHSAFPTFHLLNKERLARIKPDSLFINTSRGAVVDNQALADLYQQNCVMQSVIDVWENEPVINRRLLHYASIATPHIAGHSIHGKTQGTIDIVRKIRTHFALHAHTSNTSSVDKNIIKTRKTSRYALHIHPDPILCHKPYRAMANLLDEYLCRLSTTSNLCKNYPDTFSIQRGVYPLRYDFSRVDFHGSGNHAQNNQLFAIAQALGLKKKE